MRLPMPVLAAALLIALFPSGDARACGCFAPPDVSHPVIQAGERIAFTVKNGQVTAFIQIQYSGKAEQFGWLLPLPSVPTLEVGLDEMFVQLQRVTDPVFSMFTSSICNQSSGPGCGGASANSLAPRESGGFAADMGSPAVIVDSIGPYDYAVLKADDKTAMLDWLAMNHYFVPAGTDQALVPYIHPGAFFLALKLKAGKDAGDIQPVVVHYASDLPMIPLVLTSVGAVPHMGILVWVLGGSRAIPRNFHHSVLNLAALDWKTGSNYNDLLVRAVGEAPDHHTFITEYAGTTASLEGTIRVPTAKAATLEGLTDPLTFVKYLRNEGLPYPFSGPLKAVLAARIAEPQELIAEGVSSDTFYAQIDLYLQNWKSKYPNAMPIVFDAKVTAAEIKARVLDPAVVADATFRNNPFMTRLHTALSPEEMTADPVFSFNSELNEVSNQHFGNLGLDCDGNGVLSFGSDEAGSLDVAWPGGAWSAAKANAMPASLRIETISESGQPTVKTDNTSKIPRATFDDGSGLKTVCAVSPPPAQRGMLVILATLAAAAVISRRRRRRS